MDRLCVRVAAVLHVDGATISVTAGAIGRGARGASDAAAGRLDDLQLALDEGPCHDAAEDGGPVLVGDLAGPAGQRWGRFTPTTLAAGYRAVFAFPLRIGAIELGTLFLVRASPGGLDGGALADALVVADTVALILLDPPAGSPPGDATGDPAEGRAIMAEPGAPGGGLDDSAAEGRAIMAEPGASECDLDDITGDLAGGPEDDLAGEAAARLRARAASLYRPEIHQATGMVMAQLGVSAQEALVRLRALARARGQIADETARDIVARRLRLGGDLPR
ncbi:GAF and ANTAR domain-containing protein [Pseudofrankia sp. BMG5.37]|uniref:GAF and ANTAR domain-containing protein n=1 Tax=Pseudofrankia sp. BMG5.37 TaxID=3050035 RepID=UPI00289521CC|nr:GAF and ANTAR domain-containing protein [Pseudofrankia sp. BMG5.37]MDT3442394.1 GAF and ANTAR domain-containing protein [Pseudofrankia sp. BMG5.37]